LPGGRTTAIARHVSFAQITCLNFSWKGGSQFRIQEFHICSFGIILFYHFSYSEICTEKDKSHCQKINWQL